MNVTREKKKEEAIKRMKALNIIDDAIKQFEDDDVIMTSEPPLAGLYALGHEEMAMVKEFEEEHNALVYMVIPAYTEFGKLDSLLYISDYEDEWESENEDIKDGYVFTYTINHNEPLFSEFGSIAVKPMFGGLLRIG